GVTRRRPDRRAQAPRGGAAARTPAAGPRGRLRDHRARDRAHRPPSAPGAVAVGNGRGRAPGARGARGGGAGRLRHAARFADRVLLLPGDGRWSLGPVATTLTAAALSELYVAPMIELRDGARR